MPRLPGVVYPGAQDNSQRVGRAGEALAQGARQLNATLQKGLAEYRDEMARTQSMEAEAKLSDSLSRVTQDVTQNRFYSAKEIKDALGEDGVASLNPERRAMIEGNDGKLVPSWVVAEEMYVKRARAALDEASAGITVDEVTKRNWQFAAMNSARQKQYQVNGHVLRAQHEFLRVKQAESVTDILNNAQTPEDFTRARTLIESSRVLDADEKVRMSTAVTQREDTTPIVKALQDGDPKALLQQRTELDNPKAKRSLTPEQRLSYKRSIDDALEGFTRAARPPKEEDVRKANTEQYRGELQTFLEEYEARVADGTQKQRLYQDPKVRANMLRRFLPGDVPMDAGAREQMRELILRETTPPKPGAKEAKAKKEVSPESFEVYERLNSLTAKGNPAGIEEFKTGTFYLSDEDREAGRSTSLVDLRAQGLISDAHFFQFSNLRRQLAEEKEPKDLAIRATHDRLFDGVISSPTNGYRLDPKTKNAAKQAKIGKLRSAVHMELQAEAKRLKREPDEAEITRIARAVVSDIVIKDPGFLYDSMEQPALDVGLDGPAAAAVGRATRALPASERVKATEALAKRYQKFAPAVEAAFAAPAYARDRLTPERVLEVSDVVEKNRGAIDQALGARLTNDEAENDRLRALLALDYIRKNQRR